MQRRKNDILLKSAFEEAFPDLLRFFFEDADAAFDMSRGFEFLDKELSELFPEVHRRGGSRFVDMLVKAFSRNGEQKFMLIHIEIQAQHDQHFGKRMFQYFYRIYDRYDVPITALAVFTGRQPAGSSTFRYEHLDTSLSYQYKVYHILENTPEELIAMDNPFSLIVLAAQKALLADRIPEHELAQHRLTIARILIKSKKYDNEKIRRFLYFLKAFINIDNPEINSNFDKEIALLIKDHSPMGIIETIKLIAREEALEEGKAIFVRYLLKNTAFDVAKIAELAEIDEDFVIMIQGEK